MSTFNRTMRAVAIKALQCGSIPKHIGLIMDGNRRYGRKVHVGNGKGYYLGYETLEEILAVCMEMGVKVVTVYAFSIENFKRPADQVETLMELAKTKLAELCEQSELVRQYGIGIRVLGDTSLLPDDVRKVIRKAVDLTKKNNRAILNMCFPYTSREELTMATRSLVSGIEAHDLNPSDISTSVLEESLYTRSCPPMDILIRTSGEIRLSDFMLWQSSRACHVEFVDCFWPEFTFWKLLPILLRYQLRAISIAQSRREYGRGEGAGEEEDDSEAVLLNTDVIKAQETSLEQEQGFVMMSQRNSSESTLVTCEMDETVEVELPCGPMLEKKQRVSSFLHHRGHLPNCPIVHLQ